MRLQSELRPTEFKLVSIQDLKTVVGSGFRAFGLAEITISMIGRKP
jgi:hypothetical protein